jgi:hypothetical protein
LLAPGKLPRLAEENPLGADEFGGRGTPTSLRGPFERGAGALGRELLGVAPRGALICPPPRDIPADGGRGADCGCICGETERAVVFGRTPFTGFRDIPPGLPRDMPGPPAFAGFRDIPTPPALGGRGIERDPTELGARIELPAFGDADPRSGIRAPLAGLRPPFPGLEMPRLAPICGEPVFPRPIPGVFRAPAIPLRLVVGGVIWLTTGRAKFRAGAAPRDVPPVIVVRVGRTSGERTADSDVRLSWFGETRTEFRETDSELTSVLREAAVNPFGERRFA